MATVHEELTIEAPQPGADLKETGRIEPNKMGYSLWGVIAAWLGGLGAIVGGVAGLAAATPALLDALANHGLIAKRQQEAIVVRTDPPPIPTSTVATPPAKPVTVPAQHAGVAPHPKPPTTKMVNVYTYTPKVVDTYTFTPSRVRPTTFDTATPDYSTYDTATPDSSGYDYGHVDYSPADYGSSYISPNK